MVDYLNEFIKEFKMGIVAAAAAAVIYIIKKLFDYLGDAIVSKNKIELSQFVTETPAYKQLNSKVDSLTQIVKRQELNLKIINKKLSALEEDSFDDQTKADFRKALDNIIEMKTTLELLSKKL